MFAQHPADTHMHTCTHITYTHAHTSHAHTHHMHTRTHVHTAHTCTHITCTRVYTHTCAHIHLDKVNIANLDELQNRHVRSDDGSHNQ